MKIFFLLFFLCTIAISLLGQAPPIMVRECFYFNLNAVITFEGEEQKSVEVVDEACYLIDMGDFIEFLVPNQVSWFFPIVKRFSPEGKQILSMAVLHKDSVVYLTLLNSSFGGTWYMVLQEEGSDASFEYLLHRPMQE